MAECILGVIQKETTVSFLDPNKPLATCVSQSCADCPVHKTLHCHFGPSDLARFMIFTSPSLLVGGAGIFRVGVGFLAPWFAILLSNFGLVEIRVMCSHCPHYTEPGATLRCWANYGSPKIWQYRPGPMSCAETAVFWIGLFAVWGYPLAFLLVGAEWLLLIVFVLFSVGAAMATKSHMCSQCINFACPLNSVGEDMRTSFFERNPSVAKAWDVNVKT